MPVIDEQRFYQEFVRVLVLREGPWREANALVSFPGIGRALRPKIGVVVLSLR